MLGYDEASWAEDWGSEQTGGRSNGGRRAGPGDAELSKILDQKQGDRKYQQMQRQRSGLPAHNCAAAIVEMCAKNQVKNEPLLLPPPPPPLRGTAP